LNLNHLIYKKQKTSTSLSPKQNQSAATHLKPLNKYTELNPNDDANNMDTDQPNNLSETETHTPPPIFIKSNLNYNGFCNAIKTAIGSNDFTCKSNLNELKLQNNGSQNNGNFVMYLELISELI